MNKHEALVEWYCHEKTDVWRQKKNPFAVPSVRHKSRCPNSNAGDWQHDPWDGL